MAEFAGYQLPRVLAAAQCVRLGITPARIRTEVRRGNWSRMTTGVILTRPERPTRSDWAEAGVILAGPGTAVTGWDALRARGLGGREPPPSPPVVLARRGMSRAVGGVRIRRTTRPFSRWTTPAECDHVPLTPVVAVARATADAALELRQASAVQALVASVLQRHACVLEDLLAELASGPRNNSALLRAALGDLAAGARSVAEIHAARRLAHGPVPAFELNVPIVFAGRVILVVDALWRELRAVLEIDSREFHFSAGEWAATMQRHNRLIRLGFAVAHYPPSAVRQRGWVDEVAAWLRSRAMELGRPLPDTRGPVRPPAGGRAVPFIVG